VYDTKNNQPNGGKRENNNGGGSSSARVGCGRCAGAISDWSDAELFFAGDRISGAYRAKLFRAGSAADAGLAAGRDGSQCTVHAGIFAAATADAMNEQQREIWTASKRGNLMRMIAALACCLICAGCTPDLYGIVLGVKPGQTIDIVTASPSQVVLQYTHSYSWELAAAGQRADRLCGRFARHASLVSTVRESVDRSVATFGCE
jgi:hypothetical protein